MIVFHSDLDNTLIYSHRRPIAGSKVCVEIYRGREVSFLTEKSRELLRQIIRKVIFVPTTTRTEEQYRRIDLGIGIPEYALVCNGGVLLVNGIEEESWYQQSRELIVCSVEDLERARLCMEKDANRTLEVRNIRNLFLFTKSNRPQESADRLRSVLSSGQTDVFCNGEKVYVVPKKLDKGTAVRRFRERIRADRVIAAGDSRFDVPMLREADEAILPCNLAKEYTDRNRTVCFGDIFSDELLEYVMQNL